MSVFILVLSPGVLLCVSFHPIHKKQFAPQNLSATLSPVPPLTPETEQSDIQPSYPDLMVPIMHMHTPTNEH